MPESLRADVARDTCGMAEDEGEVRHVLSDDRPSADESPPSDRPKGSAADDRRVSADTGPLAEQRAAERPVVVALEHPRRRDRRGIEVVRRRAMRSQEDAILQRDATVERDPVLDLAAIADDHPGVDEN